MSEFLRALGYDPQRYWLFAWSCFSLWMLSCVCRREPEQVGIRPPRLPSAVVTLFGRPWVYALLLLLAMVAFRWPAVCFYKPVNPDEPQFLAGAMTMLARREVWWPDEMTSGPLVVLPLTVPGLFGFAINYATGRAVGLVLSWIVAIFAYLTLRHVHGDRLGRLLNLPLACFVVLLSFWDFTAYCSEWLPLALFSASIWLCLSAFAADGTPISRWRLAGAGAVLGILPFGKLQSLPLGAALGLAAIVLVMRQPAVDQRRIGRDLVGFLAGTAGSFLACVAWVWSSGHARFFYMSYLRHNLSYAQDRAVPWTESVREFAYLSGFSWGFSSFLGGLLIVFVVGLLALRRLPKPAWRPILVSWLLLGAAYYSISAPGRAYPHYLLFFTLPLALAAGFLFGHLLAQRAAQATLRTALLALLVVAGVAGQLAERLLAPRPMLRLLAAPGTRAGIDGLLNRLKRPGDTLAVWGWRPELFVEAQLPQGVRDAHTERQMQDYPGRDFFRQLYLADLQAADPAFFVDAVGQGGFIFQDRAVFGLETYAALNDYVVRHYQLLGEVDTFRLYLRRDRAPPGQR